MTMKRIEKISIDVVTASVLAFVFFVHMIVTYSYYGIISIPVEGDSLAYHIPIARDIISGRILNPTFYLGFYPSVGEIILAAFIFLTIPLNLYNIAALITLSFGIFFLGKYFRLSRESSLLLSISITSSHVFLRWLHSQVIDIWFAVFFVGSLIAFERLKKHAKSFFYVGLFIGLLIGTKYSGPLFACVIIVSYLRSLIINCTLKNLIAFLIPVMVLGGFWYVRNVITIGNPIYPQPFLHFQGFKGWSIFNIQMGEALFSYPLLFFNAIFAEFMLWWIAIMVVYIVTFFHKKTRGIILQKYKRVLFPSIISFFIWLLLPTSNEYNIIVSSFRYSYPFYIYAMLYLSIIAQTHKKEYVLVLLLFLSFSLLPSLSYTPKLGIVTFIVLVLLYYIRVLIVKNLKI